MNSQDSPAYRAIISRRIVFQTTIEPAIIVIHCGKIKRIIKGPTSNKEKYLRRTYPGIAIDDFGALVVMSGLVDSHVHVNEPGRTEWEGFYSATRAAASGGVTTIADMPLNSIPPTTTLENLLTKVKATRDKIFVDVAFWGGVIPGNQNELLGLVQAGVVGFKCFLCPSGVDEFPQVSSEDVEKALQVLQSTNSLLAFHAEFEDNEESCIPTGDPSLYETFLKSRPGIMERNAIQTVCMWCKKYNVRCHIVHLSAAECLRLVREAKKNHCRITVETCYHYLTLSSEEIPRAATEFKCCPPIREKSNQEKLWNGITDGTIDMVVSDHSPSVPELKASGDFIKSWGGISSLQFGLPLMWTAAESTGIDLCDISRLTSYNPAKLCGVDDRKGKIEEGMDADFVIWDPDKLIEVDEEDIYYKNKLSPYMGRTLRGEVIATVLRGQYIYENNTFLEKPLGRVLLNPNYC